MKHLIKATAGSAEFRSAFREIRDAFIAKLDEYLVAEGKVKFKACDADGIPYAWVWDDDQFRNVHFEGTIDDARDFMAHMIDQGMRFAFAGSRQSGDLHVWLTTWEYPENGPKWPQGVVPAFEEIHEGVLREDP